jgi:hypothetical protein
LAVHRTVLPTGLSSHSPRRDIIKTTAAVYARKIASVNPTFEVTSSFNIWSSALRAPRTETANRTNKPM